MRPVIQSFRLVTGCIFFVHVSKLPANETNLSYVRLVAEITLSQTTNVVDNL